MSKVQPKHKDPTGTGHKHRWECPAGHKSWERTNSHLWCHGCSQETDHNPDADPEWYELKDTRSGELVPFSELKEEWPPLEDVPAY